MLKNTVLKQAEDLGRQGRFNEMQVLCQQMIEETENVGFLLDIGILLLNAGCLNQAYHCFARGGTLAPEDFRAHINLANLAREPEAMAKPVISTLTC